MYINLKLIKHLILNVDISFMNKDYKIENSAIITDWILNADLIPLDNNFDKLLKGFIETPGRMVQPSYNFYVSSLCIFQYTYVVQFLYFIYLNVLLFNCMLVIFNDLT